MERTHRRAGLAQVLLWLALAAAALTALLLLATPAQAAPLAGANSDIDRLCVVAAAISDRTIQANDATASDVSMASAGLPMDSLAVYFGMEAPFNELTVNVGTPGTSGTIEWTYWNGVSWIVLTVTDNTNHFRSAGTHTITFTPPANWAKTTAHQDCPTAFYYLRTATAISYTVAPLASQISAQSFNLRLRVEDELGAPLAGLPQAAFRVSAGTDNTFFAFREVGSGGYDLSLAAETADRNYDLEIEKDGFVTNVDTATGTLASAQTDLSGAPIRLQYAYKVTGITAEGSGGALSSATVAAGDGFSTPCTEASAAWYCPVPVEQSGLNVQVVKDGFVSDASAKFASDRVVHVDAQRTLSVSNLRVTVKVIVLGQTSLASVVWEKSVNEGPFAPVVPLSTSSNQALFALSPSEAKVVLRATKGGLAGSTGEPFTPSASSQLERAISLVSTGAAPSSAPASPSPTVPTTTVSTTPKALPAKATAPAQAGPVFALGWTSTALAPGMSIELWVLEGSAAPRLHHRTLEGSGSVAFYGVASHTYHFFALTNAGPAAGAVPGLAAASADATTRVTSDRVTIDPAALALVGAVPAGQAFHATDTDADGFPETFEDPTGQLSLVRIVGRERLEPALLLRGADALYLWDLRANDLAAVHAQEATPLGGAEDPSVRLRHDAPDGWTLVSTPDPRPGEAIERVLRGDGSEVPGDLYWQEEGRSFVLDDASREYEIQYARAPAQAGLSWLAGAAALLAALALGFVAWLHWPSVERLSAKEGPRGGAARALRHCGRCQAPLPRAQRLFRALHRCDEPKTPAQAAAPREIPMIPK